MRQKKVEINGQEIAYYESGGKGRPILFVHGNSMSGLCFEKQFKSNLGNKYRLVAVDLPGHGGSAPAQDPGSAYTLPGYAFTVSMLARMLEIEDALLVGWSLGGHVLIEAMEQMQRWAGIMLFGTPPVGNPLTEAAFLPHPLTHLLFTSDLSGDEAAALTGAFFSPDCRIAGFFHEDMRRTDGRARGELGRSIGAGNYADEIRIVAECQKPVAIVHGENDPFISLPYLSGLSIPTLWRGDIQIITAAGHAPHWEQAAGFNDLLTAFITDCKQPS